MPRTAPRPRTAAAWVAGGLGVFGAVAFALQALHGAAAAPPIAAGAPAAPAPDAPPPNAAAPRATAALDASAALPRVELDTGDGPVGPIEPRMPSIAGVVKDTSGEPVAGAIVLLTSAGRPTPGARGVPEPAVLPPRGFGGDAATLGLGRAMARMAAQPPPEVAQAVSGERGEFQFPSVDPGDYQLAIEGLPDTAQTFFLFPGEQRRFELVCGRTLAVGRLMRGGRAAIQCLVEFTSGQRTVHGAQGEGGLVRAWLQPGHYDVTVYSRLWPDVPLARRSLEVPAGRERIDWDCAVGGVDVTFELQADHRRVEVGFSVRLEGTPDATGQPTVRETSGGGGLASVPLPAGRWRALVRSAELAEVPPRELVLEAHTMSEHVTIDVVRATALQLELRTPGRAAWAVEPGALPWLATGGALLPCVELEGASGDGRRPILGWRSVPAGRAELVLDDRVTGDQWTFLPFDPQPPKVFDVVIGPSLRITLDVVPRARVELCACEAGGRDQVDARIELFAGGRAVRSGPAAAWCWRGFLPPGDYRVAIDRKGHRREHALRVERADVVRRFRP